MDRALQRFVRLIRTVFTDCVHEPLELRFGLGLRFGCWHRQFPFLNLIQIAIRPAAVINVNATFTPTSHNNVLFISSRIIFVPRIVLG